MSVDYNSILVVGKWFERTSEAQAFLAVSGTVLSGEDIRRYGFVDLVENEEDGLTFQQVGFYTGNTSGALGYSLDTANASVFIADVKEAADKFFARFGIEAEILCDVQVSYPT